MDSETKRTSILAIVSVFIAALTAAVAVTVAVFYSHTRFSTFPLLITLVAILSIEFIFIWRKCKNVRTMDKGKLIMEIKKDNAPFLYPILSFCILFGLLASVAVQNPPILIFYYSSLSIFILCLFIIVGIEIYEKGILHGCIFIKWDEIEEVKKKGKYLVILAKKFKRARIKDENGKVEEIIKKYVPDKFVNE